MTRPRVLVLMATFNGAAWIREQVDSIAAQRDVDVTLAVCDDGSSDATVQRLAEATPEALNLTLVKPARPGGSAARNFFRLMEAADASPHDFVALADQDDVWEPHKLARATQELRASSAVGYSAPVRAFWPDGRTAVLRQSSSHTTADYVFEGAGQGCTFVLRAGYFRMLQQQLAEHRDRLAPLHYHDWALYALCRAGGHAWLFDDRVCMAYRQHAANDTGARSGKSGIGRRLALIRSGWYAEQVWATAVLAAAASDGAAAGAVRYLTLVTRTRTHRLARFSLAMFVLRQGRRRLSDRLVLAWAALGGYLR